MLAGLASQAGCEAAVLQGLECLFSPKQLGERERNDRWVLAGLSRAFQLRTVVVIPGRGPNSPPRRDDFPDFIHMRRRSDDGHEIQGAVVDVYLTGKPCEGVALTLYLIAVDASVHDGNIHSRNALAEAEFLNYAGVRFAKMKTCILSQLPADIDVAHG